MDRQDEGSKFWIQVVTELKNRGVEQTYVACVDGLKGFPEAISSVFPSTIVQLCIVHMVRNSVNYVSYKDLKEVRSDLKQIYTANNDEMARLKLQQFGVKWDAKYPVISDIWQLHWLGIAPRLSFPKGIRKAIYTTNILNQPIAKSGKLLKIKECFQMINQFKK